MPLGTRTFASSRSLVYDASVLVMDFEWDGDTLIESGLTLWDTKSNSFESRHLTRQGEWLKVRKYGKKPAFVPSVSKSNIDVASVTLTSTVVLARTYARV